MRAHAHEQLVNAVDDKAASCTGRGRCRRCSSSIGSKLLNYAKQMRQTLHAPPSNPPLPLPPPLPHREHVDKCDPHPCTCITRHTSHVTRHSSHVTRHTSHVIPSACLCASGRAHICFAAAADGVSQGARARTYTQTNKRAHAHAHAHTHTRTRTPAAAT